MPNWGTWNDVPAGEQNQLNSLADQWGQLIGFVYQPTQAELLQMANAGVTSVTQFGRWMWDNGGYHGTPASALGLNQEAYNSKYQSFNEIFKQLTGQDLPQIGSGDPYTVNLWFGALSNQMGTSDFRSLLMHDLATQQNFGWLKHGLTYDDFKLQKQQMQLGFGRELSNEEAIQELTYYKRAQGSDFTATQAKPTGQQQQGPSQSEVTVR